MKKAKIFGRSIPVLAIVAIAASAGMVSAALLSYYGTIEGKVNVLQSVLVDGKEDYSIPSNYEIVDAVGGTYVDGPHTLMNRAHVQAPVKLVTDQQPGGDVEGITTSYWKLTGFSDTKSTDATNISVKDLGDKVKWTITVDWDKVPYGASHAATALMIGDKDKNILYQIHNNDGVDPDYNVGTWLYSEYEDGWYTGGETANSIPISVLDWVKASGGLETDGVTIIITIDKTHLAFDEFKWVLRVPQEFTNPDFGWGDTDMTNTDTATVGKEITTYTLQPGETLNFYIVNEFNVALVHGTYTITTTVEPVL